MQMIKYLLSCLAALIALTSPAAAQDMEGTWALQIDDASVFVFLLERDEADNWRGAWLRPRQFQGNGVIFSQIRGSEAVYTTDASMADEVLVLRFAPTRAEGSTDILQFRSTGENQAELTYIGTNLEPYPLVRVVAGTGLGPFSDDRIYDRDNAATQADYDPADEPTGEEPAQTEGEATGPTEVEPLEGEADETIADPAEEERGRISDDFLDGLDEEAPIAATDTETDQTDEPEPTDAPSFTRACDDIDRDNLPSAEELVALWGDDFESIGLGLEIREYQMENGDVARVTLLGERIYLNHCGPAS